MIDNLYTIPSELFSTFDNAIYYDEPHRYFNNDNEFISVTTLIHKYQETFDENYWSNVKSEQFGITQEEVLRAWKFINKKGTMKGSIIHDYSENRLRNKVFPYPKKEILSEFGFDPILKEYEITKKHVDNFHKKTKGRLIPISAEHVVYDIPLKIAGMFDILYWNVREREYQIWDNKTNKEFTENSDRRLLDSLELLEDSDLEIYSLQLEMYKQIIERNTNIKLGKSYVVWFSHNNSNFKIIPMKDRKYYIDKIFCDRMLELTA